MTLVLIIKGLDRLDNGEAARLKLDRHGARIGRSPHMDWSLPDPRSYISSTHCEIEYRDGGYILIDRSTNGTFVNGATARLPGPHRIAHGDILLVGHYEIVAQVEGAEASILQGPAGAPSWGGWDSHVPAEPVGVDPAKWDRPAPQPAISGLGAASNAWAAPRIENPPASAWGAPAAGSSSAPSAWSSEPQAPAAPSADDVWGRLASTNDVDWARGGFGSPSPAASPPPIAPASAPATAGWGSPAAPAAFAMPAAAAPSASSGAEWTAFLSAAGLQPADVKISPAEAMSAAGALLKRLIGGMIVMMEARARAKAQLGAQNTSLEFDGNNPLKFARTSERALAQMLNPAERGFMSSDRAVEDSFRDLQAHQLATLQAMQGALAATLARFSPGSIRERAETRGLLSKILPNAREAALWQAYEREFEGVARGSDEAFMDVFAKEFRQAYERVAADMKAKSR